MRKRQNRNREPTQRYRAKYKCDFYIRGTVRGWFATRRGGQPALARLGPRGAPALPADNYAIDMPRHDITRAVSHDDYMLQYDD